MRKRCLNKNSLSLVVFLFTCGNFTLIFTVFDFLDRIFFSTVFPIHSYSVLGLVFCLVNENFLNCTSGLVLLCFLFRRLTLFFLFTFVHTAKLKSNFLNEFLHSLTSFARVTSFLTPFSKSF